MEKLKIEVLNNDLFLDYECMNCDNPQFQDENGICEICNGIGMVPSENGRAILEFINRYFKGNKL